MKILENVTIGGVNPKKEKTNLPAIMPKNAIDETQEMGQRFRGVAPEEGTLCRAILRAQGDTDGDRTPRKSTAQSGIIGNTAIAIKDAVVVSGSTPLNLITPSKTATVQKSPITVKDLLGIPQISDPQISPDGTKIAFVVTENLMEENKTNSQIWIHNLKDGKETPLTDGSKSSSQPRWSPDGKNIAFTSNRDGISQIWSMSTGGGAPTKITGLSTGASSPRWSPDGKSILFTSNVFPDCKTDEENKKRMEDRDKSKVKALLYEHLGVRHWDSFFDGTYSHLFIAPSIGGEAKDLTNGSINVPPIALGSNHDYTFSPEGTEVCFVTNRDKVVQESTNNDLFVISLTDGKEKQITASRGNDYQPRYSPDGNYIAYASMERPGFESDRVRIMLYDRSSGETKELTKGFDDTVKNFTWAPASDKIYFNVEEKGYNCLYSANLNGDIKKISESANAFDFSISPKGEFAAILSGSIKKPTELYTIDLQTGKETQLTHFSDEKLKNIELGDFEEFWFKGAKGTDVHGFLVKPPNFDPSKKYPMLYLMHGGPQSMFTNTFGTGWSPQVFASTGNVVAMVNPRGSKGYGQKFTDEISGDWGGKPYEDLMKGVDYLLETYPFIDGDKMAAAGGSYGGYMANWVEGHTGRFKCLVSHCGPFNLESKYGATDEQWFPEWEFKGTPWTNPEQYNKWSPHKYINNFKTPMLVIHGQKDYRVPIEEGLQMFTALQKKNVPSKLLYFPDEGHWVLKPQNRELWYNTFLGWLDQWIK